LETLEGDNVEKLKSNTVEEIWETTAETNVLYPDTWKVAAKESLLKFQEILLKMAMDFQRENCESGRVFAVNK